MLAVLVLLLAPAAATPAALVLPSTGDEVDADKLHRAVKVAVARPDLAFPSDVDVDRDALRTQIARRPNECTADLSDEVTAQLGALRGDDELYVALPTSKRARDTLLWRFDASSQLLQRVLNLGPVVAPPPVDGEVHVVLVPWLGTDQAERGLSPADVRPQVGTATTSVGAPEAGLGPEFIDQLMEHPNECSPELTDAMAEALAAAEGEVPLYVAVELPSGRHRLILWRWVPEERALSRVLRRL